MTREEMQARVEELDKLISECPHWGAALSAYDEERGELKRALYRIEREFVSSRTPAQEAVRTLTDELRKQPLLAIWFSTQPWMIALAPILEDLGYLSPPYEMNGFMVRDVLPKAQELLHETPKRP